MTIFGLKVSKLSWALSVKLELEMNISAGWIKSILATKGNQVRKEKQ